MELFPAVDPIPLPAPVWLFKALHILTLSLHFFAVHFLVGGLALATLWALWGRARRDEVLLNASGLVTHRLPIVMTFVINLGVPPLLFTQALYGRAFYTSTVLMAVWWFSIVFLLMLSYSFLYYMAKRADAGRASGWVGLIALVVVLKIGFLLSSAMTLMLRPEAWAAMYKASPSGLFLPKGDPSTLPRWLFMMLGSVGVSGVALIFLSLKKDIEKDVSRFFCRWGGRVLALFTAVQIVLAWWVFRSQPETVRADLLSGGVYPALAVIWFLTALGTIGAGALVSARTSTGWGLPSGIAGLAFLNVASMVVLRDGIRDLSLAAKGFDVWSLPVATNWSTVIVFFLCFVLALVMMVWLVSVVARAKPQPERYA